MSRLSKKDRKRLKRAEDSPQGYDPAPTRSVSSTAQKSVEQPSAEPQSPPKPSLRKITQANWGFLIFLVTVCFLVYFNSLDNQLTLVDDMQGIVFDETIKSIPGALKTMNLQKVLYSVSYRFFEYNPLPIRSLSVGLHIINTLLAFYFIYLIWGKRIARMATLVFAVHTINTEAATWISGSPYLLYAFFTFTIFILYLLFYAKKQKIYLFSAVAIYIFEILVMQSPWVLVPPMALVVLDQLIVGKKYDLSRLWWIVLFAIPVSIYLITYFGPAFEARLEARSEGGTRITMHTQALKPVIEGYPYSTYLMSRLYLVPANLTVYYDGMEVNTGLYIAMYSAFIVYASVVIYLLKKQRQLAGILIMLPFLMAPAYSPIKITWFLSERYLYSGTAFIGVLVAMGTIYLQRRTNKKYLAYGLLSLLLIILAVGTVRRNNDWQDTETLSYANMRAAPLSVRPYNDMGGHYYYKGDIKRAVDWYEKGLQVVPTSGTAINNLGFIYFELGPLIFWDDLVWPEPDPEKAAELYEAGVQLMQEGAEPRTISYFFNKSLVFDPQNIEVILHTAEMYKSLRMPEDASRLYRRVLEIDPENGYALTALTSLQ